MAQSEGCLSMLQVHNREALPTLLVTREVTEHANVFHTLTDLLNVYISLRMLGLGNHSRCCPCLIVPPPCCTALLFCYQALLMWYHRCYRNHPAPQNTSILYGIPAPTLHYATYSVETTFLFAHNSVSWCIAVSPLLCCRPHKTTLHPAGHQIM